MFRSASALKMSPASGDGRELQIGRRLENGPGLELEEISMKEDSENFETTFAKEFEEMWSEVNSKFTKEDLRDLTRVDSRAKLETLIETVQKDNEEHKKRHSKKWRGSSGRLQKICATMSRLLEGYSGIGDIIKSIHPHGGPLAYGTLSILLTVCRNKEDREDMIAVSLENVINWLHITPSYQDVYQDIKTQRLTQLVVNVYKSMYGFVIDICTYATSKRVRYGKSFIPPKYNTQLPIDKMKVAIDAMSEETTMLLHMRVRDVQSDNKMLQQKVKDMDQRLRVNDQANWDDFIFRIQSRFNVPEATSNDPCTEHKVFKDAVASVMDSEDTESIASIEEGNLEVLHERAEFKEWKACSRSSLLLLRVVNHRDADNNAPLWLSQAVAELAISLRQDSQRTIYHVVKRNHNEPCSTIGDIIYQIMSWDEAFYRQHKQTVENGLGPKDVLLKTCLELANLLLTAWSVAHEQDWTYLIIDRVDEWIRSSRAHVPADFELVMKGFLGMLESKFARIKICLLVDNSQWSSHIQTYVNLLNWRGRFIDTKGWQQADALYI